MNLHHDLSLDHCVVVHVGVEISEAAGREGSHLCRVKVVAHSDFECSGQDGDVLTMRMPVESNAVAAGHLQTDRKVAGGRCGVAPENGELRTRRQEGRRFTPLNGIPGESVFRVLRVCCARQKLGRKTSCSNYSECYEQRSFYFFASFPSNLSLPRS